MNRDLERRVQRVERAPVRRAVDVRARVTPPVEPVAVVKKKPRELPEFHRPPFYMAVWDEDAESSAIVKSTGAVWLPVSSDTGLPLLADFPNEFSLAQRAAGRHWLGLKIDGGFSGSSHLFVSEAAAAWADSAVTDNFITLAASQDVAWLLSHSGPDPTVIQRFDAESATWITVASLENSESANDGSVHPSNPDIVSFGHWQSGGDPYMIVSQDGATFAAHLMIEDGLVLGAVLGPTGSFAFIDEPSRGGSQLLFTASGRLLYLCVVKSDGGDEHLFDTDYALVFRADAPYTDWSSFSIVAGPRASQAWLLEDSQLGFARAADSATLYALSNHSSEPANPDGPNASEPAGGHVYMSADDGETWTELAAPGGIVRGLYYHAPNGRLYAQMKDGSVLTMPTPGPAGAWEDFTRNLLTALDTSSVIPYVNNGIWS